MRRMNDETRRIRDEEIENTMVADYLHDLDQYGSGRRRRKSKRSSKRNKKYTRNRFY